MLAARIGVAGFGANSLSSQEAGAIRRSSRRDSKIPQACPAGFLCFSANQSETNSNCLQIKSFSSRSERVPACLRLMPRVLTFCSRKVLKIPRDQLGGIRNKAQSEQSGAPMLQKRLAPSGLIDLAESGELVELIE